MVDRHREGERQGPGSDSETCRALELTRLDRNANLKIADIGCGTGASTLVLASQLPNASITAVDLFPEFLEVLTRNAEEAGHANRIETLNASMDSLSFQESTFDLIWSEGAIYNIGFKKGLEAWYPLLRVGGVLAVSEITWLHPKPPTEILDHWNSEYPEIATAPEKIATLESAGYDLLGYFTLPASCWIDNYYASIAERMPSFLERHIDEQTAIEIAELERQEAELYRRYQNWFSYGFYIAKKR